MIFARLNRLRRTICSFAIASIAILLCATIAVAASPTATVTTAPTPDAASVAPSSQRSIAAVAPPPKPIDWDKVTREATDLLSQYIQINTTNPPGNEIATARMLKEKFLADGIAATTWEPEPGRGVVAARLRGIGKHTKSLILLSHMDVVPANPKEWEVPPFSGQIKDGKIWGRGAIDDKGPGVVELMAMLAIKRAGILLDRDILFVATGDEEEGGKNGAQWFVDHQEDIFSDADSLLNEGGGIRAQPDGRKTYMVSVSEKTPMWLKLTAQGTPGHASDPPAETAVTKLVRALQKLDDYKTPIRVIGPVDDYYRALGEINRGPKQFLNLNAALKDPAYLKQFLAEPNQNAHVRDTITPTVLSASNKTNVISETAYAEVDCRLLPGSDPQNFLKDIKTVISDDSIKVDVILNFPPISSPTRSPLMTAINTLAARRDKARVVPMMIIGFTDSHYFRQKKIAAYGFIPIEITTAEAHGVHGVNERIGVKELTEGIQRMVELLKLFGRR
ncbi:MAG: M20/M25/M40 family metallo-hydrolase [Candidatus Binatus sp.]|uniref:M20/M25/M40 family metallo-hydrolase n=1 Tax=Candidatus Binatus sp. TaxID=2811406 RepID=UPI00271A2896|nr:M20/M25/M40 family metallo-hydrolase [Candidatus Binatus sp.]MDO8432280.1 M20/M25/M40 family metallo-hydrolase [Candidatus Binatus sp.]